MTEEMLLLQAPRLRKRGVPPKATFQVYFVSTEKFLAFFLFSYFQQGTCRHGHVGLVCVKHRKVPPRVNYLLELLDKFALTLQVCRRRPHERHCLLAVNSGGRVQHNTCLGSYPLSYFLFGEILAILWFYRMFRRLKTYTPSSLLFFAMFVCERERGGQF